MAPGWPRANRPRHVVRLLDRDGRQAAAAACRRAVGDSAMSPIAEISGWPGTVQVGARPRSGLPVLGRSVARATSVDRRRLHARRPRRRRMRSSLAVPTSASPVVGRSPWHDLAQPSRRRGQLLERLLRPTSFSLERREQRSPASTQDAACASSVGDAADSRLAKSLRRASASAPRVSTPVGPPPTTTKVSQSPSVDRAGSAVGLPRTPQNDASLSRRRPSASSARTTCSAHSSTPK